MISQADEAYEFDPLFGDHDWPILSFDNENKE